MAASENIKSVVEQVPVVVCVYESHRDLLQRLWQNKYQGEVKFVTVKPGYELKPLLADIIADESVADRFVLFNADTVPCSTVIKEELFCPVVYVTATGEEKYDENLPLIAEKSKLVELLAEEKNTNTDIVKALLKAGTRPNYVGFSFGNYVTPVRRGNPCEHLVIEALIRKKFIIASLDGFDAIKHLLEK